MALIGIVHKQSEENWTVEERDGSELPVLPSDVIAFYHEMPTCGEPGCQCWIMAEGLAVEYKVVSVDGISYANLI